jgi:hypothetical protein
MECQQNVTHDRWDFAPSVGIDVISDLADRLLMRAPRAAKRDGMFGSGHLAHTRRRGLGRFEMFGSTAATQGGGTFATFATMTMATQGGGTF